MKKLLWFVSLFALAVVHGAQACGERLVIPTHNNTTMPYSLAKPVGKGQAPVVLVLLAGGGGYLKLDDAGCPRKLMGNSLARSAPIFRELGFTTVLVDAPSDYSDEDGLAGFRIAPEHAEDLGKLIVALRQKTGAAVWVVGTSRGSISAANAASRLQGEAAPDGMVLTSILTIGDQGMRRAWVAQTVFDLPLESIRMPTLLIGHADDQCLRSPPAQMETVAARIPAVRKQVVTVTGGSGKASGNLSGLSACEGKAPHGYIGQEAEVAAGIARFVRGGSY